MKNAMAYHIRSHTDVQQSAYSRYKSTSESTNNVCNTEINKTRYNRGQTK